MAGLKDYKYKVINFYLNNYGNSAKPITNYNDEIMDLFNKFKHQCSDSLIKLLMEYNKIERFFPLMHISHCIKDAKEPPPFENRSLTNGFVEKYMEL